MAKTRCTISLGLYDTTARRDASYVAAETQLFSDMAVFNREEAVPVPKLATLEDSFFWLDGTFDPFPDDYSTLGYMFWSYQQSFADGMFLWPPQITITFSGNHSSVGLTFRFYEPTNDYADLMNVQWYDGDGYLLSEKQFMPDSALYFADNPVENYQKIVVTFLHTSKPSRYIKLAEIRYGLEVAFGNDMVVSASTIEELDTLSSQLSVNTLTATVYSNDSRYSPLNPTGSAAYLQQNQRVTVNEYIDSVQVPMGTFFLTSWKDASDNKIEFSAVDPVGILDQTNFDGGIFTSVSVSDLISGIISPTELKYDISPQYTTSQLSGYLPIATRRAALQQVAIAMGAVVDDSRSDTIRIFPPPDSPSLYIQKERKIAGGKVELRAVVTGASVSSHRYVLDDKVEEILKETKDSGVYRVEFGQPMGALTATNAAIIESNANYAVISVSEESDVILSGKKYNDSQTVFSESPPLPAGIIANAVQLTDATLIGETEAKQRATDIYKYFQWRYQNEFRLLTGKEKVGDYVVVDSLRGEKLRGIIEYMQTDLTGGFLSAIKLTGERIIVTAFDYTGEIYAGESIGVI